MADVFVSYDRRDRDLAEKVVNTLTEQGLTVWWDDRITPHETWDKTIEREVDSARRVLVLWTNNSVQSDWVRTEAGAAKESTPPKLIQARFSDCKVPLAFRLLQHVDLIGWTPKKKHAGWDRLVGWLKADEGSPQAKPAPAPAAPKPVAPPRAAAPAQETPAPMGLANMAAASEPAPAQGAQPQPLAGLNETASAAAGAAADVAHKATDAAKTAAAGAGAALNKAMADDGKKKMLIIGGAVVGGLVLIGVLWMVLSPMMGGGSVGGGAANGVSAEGQTTLAGYLDHYQPQYAAGTREAGADEFASLADNAHHDFEVNLRGARDYTVIGACDTSCRDVDLQLIDGEGTFVASDLQYDDHPVMTFHAARAGRYTVRLAMPDCNADQCLAAARVLEAE